MNTISSLEIDAFAKGIGLRFDGFQDPCGAAAMTGEAKFEMMAFTCIRDGAAKGTTFYMPIGASLEQIADRWNVKLAEIFAAEHQELKRKLGIAVIAMRKVQCLIMDKPLAYQTNQQALEEIAYEE